MSQHFMPKCGGLTLVIMAAGMGSRFGGDKQLAQLGPNGETLLALSVREAIAAGFSKVVLIIRPELEQELKSSLAPMFAGQIAIAFCYQAMDDLPDGWQQFIANTEHRTKPWGTAHALWCARHHVSGPMAVINADDYYGQDAFKLLAAGFKSAPEQWQMVAYRLRNTLSEHGGVNRGVCQVENGELRSVQEWLNIRPTLASDTCSGEFAGQVKQLSADALVSMTCWGFTSSIFSVLEQQLLAFVSANANSATAECYLPSVVQSAMDGAKETRDVFKIGVSTATQTWLGVTYPQDVAEVKQKLMELLGD
ncbi:NTP transferase domain-containing protein [Shewanella sp. Scap07]|uniref:NTP transferase domain-containing protein n=1 Tax=Shewanella sp. Scap07 TaxID=2589987 RepID=UPI002117E7E0|nr:NTP transferase domain-containing protein [Shewanella sp. Scap07]